MSQGVASPAPGGTDRMVTSIVAAAAVAYASVLSVVSVLRYEAFVSDYDHGIFAQYVWLLGHFREPFNSINLRQLLGDHVEPGIALLAPLGTLGIAAPGLLVAQAIALAATAPVLLVLLRRLGVGGWLAGVIPMLWLVSPIVIRGNLFDFHPDSFVPVLLAAGALAPVADRIGLFALSVVLACSLNEDIALTYVALGLVLVWTGRRRIGAVLACAAAAWALIAVVVLAPKFGNALSDDFAPRFAGPRGDSFVDVVRYSVEHPLATTDALLTPQKLGILALLIAMTGGLALCAPRWLLVSVPSVGLNLWSAYELQDSLAYHYWIVPAGAVALAGAMGAAEVARRGVGVQRWLRGAVVAGALLGVLSAQAVNLTLHVIRDEWDERADRQAIIDAIPRDAAVSAPMQMLPHLAERARIYVIPEPLIAVLPGTRWDDADRRRATARLDFVVLDTGLKSKGSLSDAEIVREVERRGFRPVLRRGTTTLYRADEG